MCTYKCIIIDDELHTVEGLKKYIGLIPNLVLLKAYTDPVKALMELTAGEIVDLILLDVDMPQISGIELSQEIRHKTKKLVFTTAHTKYGYEAFEADADAYLLKPYSLSKFVSVISKLFPTPISSQFANGSEEDFFFVKNKEENLKLVKVRYNDVIAVESKQNYVMIYTLTQNVLTYMSLTEIAKVLSPRETFIQLHRSYIVGKNHIIHVEGNTIKMANELKVTVGDFYRKDFAEFLTTKLIKAGQKI